MRFAGVSFGRPFVTLLADRPIWGRRHRNVLRQRRRKWATNREVSWLSRRARHLRRRSIGDRALW